MAQLTPLSSESARALVRQWGLELGAIEPLAAGSVNSNFRVELGDGRVLFGRIYEEQAEAGALAELDLVRALAAAGVPTPAPLVRPDGGLLAQAGDKPFALFPWVQGEILCQARVRPAHCERVGRALGQIHLAPVSHLPEGRFRPADLAARLDRIERDAPAFAGAAREIRAALAGALARRDHSLPGGLIHGDLFRDNALWQGGELAALLDFESASRGPFVYDLMVCVHAWCFADAFDVELAAALLRGYASVRRVAPEERSALGVEGAIAALRFATTRITDYSLRAPPGAPPLRDYRRFLGRLDALGSGALDPAFAVLA